MRPSWRRLRAQIPVIPGSSAISIQKIGEELPITRSTSAQTTAISGQPLSGTAHLFQITAATAAAQSTVQPVPSGTQAVSGSSLTLTLPSLSVTTIDIY
jgi:hypothetical protein